MASTTETLLLTGATGFLGSAIAAELLEHQTGGQLLFLVRAEDAGKGLERLRTSIARMAPNPVVLDRLSADMVICGELSDFSTHLHDSRVRSINRILNAAALASFAWKQDVWSVNVEHTVKFARAVSELPELRRFLYVGTAMISGNTANRTVHEDEFPADVRQFAPYTTSKAEIERRLPAALGRVPLVVARPSIVVGHTGVGCQPSPSIFWVFRMINAAKRIPLPTRYRVDVIPVDYCARALIHLLLKQHLAHTRYHISAGPLGSCSFAEIDEAYSAVHEGAESHELTEFDIADIHTLESHFVEWFGPCNPRRMISAVHIYRVFAGLNVTFDNSRLRAEGADAPPRFTDYLGACVRTGENEPVAEQMLCDFR
jgi:nucleoside-diphosphate-sugar epimerase